MNDCTLYVQPAMWQNSMKGEQRSEKNSPIMNQGGNTQDALETHNPYKGRPICANDLLLTPPFRVPTTSQQCHCGYQHLRHMSLEDIQHPNHRIHFDINDAIYSICSGSVFILCKTAFYFILCCFCFCLTGPVSIFWKT